MLAADEVVLDVVGNAEHLEVFEHLGEVLAAALSEERYGLRRSCLERYTRRVCRAQGCEDIAHELLARLGVHHVEVFFEVCRELAGEACERFLAADAVHRDGDVLEAVLGENDVRGVDEHRLRRALPAADRLEPEVEHVLVGELARVADLHRLRPAVHAALEVLAQQRHAISGARGAPDALAVFSATSTAFL